MHIKQKLMLLMHPLVNVKPSAENEMIWLQWCTERKRAKEAMPVSMKQGKLMASQAFCTSPVSAGVFGDPELCGGASGHALYRAPSLQPGRGLPRLQ